MIAARATRLSDGDMAMTSAWGFLAGLPLGAAVIAFTTDWRPAEFAPWPVMIVAGLIVGIGTRMGSGCTSRPRGVRCEPLLAALDGRYRHLHHRRDCDGIHPLAHRRRVVSLAHRLLPPLVPGTLFGAGLTLSGMTDPARVRGFLGRFGNWDPTLAFVMGGAVLVMAVAWRIRARMTKPLFDEKFSLPGRGDFDPSLLVGSALFGIGWGIAGLCPGPAIASLALSPGAVLPFVAAMFAGMAMHRLWPAPHPLLDISSVS